MGCSPVPERTSLYTWPETGSSKSTSVNSSTLPNEGVKTILNVQLPPAAIAVWQLSVSAKSGVGKPFAAAGSNTILLRVIELSVLLTTVIGSGALATLIGCKPKLRVGASTVVGDTAASSKA